MSTIKVVIGYTDYRGEMEPLSLALALDSRLVVVSATNRGAQAVFDDAVSLGADVVLLSPLLPGYRPELVQDLLLHEDHPIPTIGLVPAAGDWARTMHEHGAKGHLVAPLDDTQIRRALQLIPEVVQAAADERASGSYVPLPTPARRVQAMDTSWRSRTIAVFSPKGGDGKTLLATNLAAALGVLAMRPTIVIDCDVKADVHTVLGLNERKNLFSLAEPMLAPFLRDVSGRNGQLNVSLQRLQEFTTPYGPRSRSKLDILIGLPRLPMAGLEVFTRQPKRVDELLGNIIDTASRHYDFTILDTGPDLNQPWHWAPLRKADLVLVLVTPTEHSIRSLRNVMEPMAKELGAERFELVINRWDEGYGVRQADIVEVVGLKKFGSIPEGGVICGRSINTHRPLVLESPPDDVGEAIIALAGNFYPPLLEISGRRGRRSVGGKLFDRLARVFVE